MRKVLFILGQLNDADVEWLATVGERRRIAPGTELIREGTQIEEMFIVLDGALSVWAGGRVKIDTAGAGEILGEMSLIDTSVTSASVRCEAPSLVLAVSKAQLRQRLAADVGFAARFYKALALFLADRMRNAITRLGYGKADEPMRGERSEDELEPEVLDNLHLAGARFERMLQKLAR